MHGSRRKSRVLIPKKPKRPPVGQPQLNQRAVYGTKVISIAVLYAIMIHDFSWRTSWKDKNIHVKPSRKEIRVRSCGYIHICHSKSFTKGPFIVRSRRAAPIVKTFRVTPALLEYFLNKEELAFVNELCDE